MFSVKQRGVSASACASTTGVNMHDQEVGDIPFVAADCGRPLDDDSLSYSHPFGYIHRFQEGGRLVPKWVLLALLVVLEGE